MGSVWMLDIIALTIIGSMSYFIHTERFSRNTRV